MHTEADIRKIAKELLERYDQLITTEIIHLIEYNIVFDSDDLKPLATKSNRRITIY